MEATVNTNTSATAATKPKAVARADKHLWGIVIALCIISVVELYSASSREVASSAFGVMGPIIRHIIMLAGGIGLVWILSKRHYSDFALFTVVFSVLSAAMMVCVLMFGEEINGAKRSISVAGFTLFPAEMVKISAVLLVALLMTLNQNPKGVGITGRGMIYSGIVLVIFSAMLATQGLTNTALLVGITLSMMVIGGVRFLHIIYAGLVFLIIAAAAGGYLYVTDYLPWKEKHDRMMQNPELALQSQEEEGQKVSRIVTWISRLERHKATEVPKWELPARGENRQEVLSYMAQAHGGITGVGPGNSREAARLPLAFSDYIYAIVVEELGLIGGITVLMLYLWLLGRAASIASRCTHTYPALLVMGMAVMIALQALFHIGIVTGYFPVSGQPLPFISKGGTSIIVTSIAFGIMLSVSRTATGKSNKIQEKREELDALPEELQGENTMQL
ncbi:MAG: FtsW/RodA/SpoVE family cell cycle protein [Muribaculaceae bacterium]|nr:FtsW/RodA/SpoVE family cell cycle protein [Muribaculaceae bacterium]